MTNEWESFYILVGGAAGALIGLLFVVVTLTAESNLETKAIGQRVYVTPTVFHFCTVLIIGATALMPHISAGEMSGLTSVLALWGLAYSVRNLVRLVQGKPAAPHWSDYLFYGVLPAAAYIFLLAAATMLWTASETGSKAVAIASLSLLVIGIRDAWDVAVWVTQHPQK